MPILVSKHVFLENIHLGGIRNGRENSVLDFGGIARHKFLHRCFQQSNI
jgi:hypothetical protein